MGVGCPGGAGALGACGMGVLGGGGGFLIVPSEDGRWRQVQQEFTARFTEAALVVLKFAFSPAVWKLCMSLN